MAYDWKPEVDQNYTFPKIVCSSRVLLLFSSLAPSIFHPSPPLFSKRLHIYSEMCVKGYDLVQYYLHDLWCWAGLEDS